MSNGAMNPAGPEFEPEVQQSEASGIALSRAGSETPTVNVEAQADAAPRPISRMRPGAASRIEGASPALAVEIAQQVEPAEAKEPVPQKAKPTRPLSRALPEATAATKRPRVALMGEFSAGKSTLSNLLIGKSALPVNVTATQLPPVWMSFGDEDPYRVDVNGEEFDIDPSLSDVTVEDTNHLRIFHQSKFLKICDLIDMPGISDPNMAASVWQRVIHNADIVIWCSHATQAWRQSEAAVWSTMPEALYDKSILLLTRMDRILSERDRARVIKRVERETKGLFRTVLPVSLIKALEAGHDAEAWAESGADALLENLVELIDEVASGKGERPKSRIRNVDAVGGVDDAIGEAVEVTPARIVMPTRVRPRPLISKPSHR